MTYRDMTVSAAMLLVSSHKKYGKRRVPQTKSRGVRRQSPKVGRNARCTCGSGRKAKKCCHAPAHTPRIPVARSRHTKSRDVAAYTLSIPPADEGFDEHEHRDWLGQGWTFPAFTEDGKLPLFRSSESAAEFAERNCPGDPVIVLACSEGQLEAFERDYETEWMDA